MIELAWGRRGAEAAARAGRVLVVVDVLSFSTGVVAACARGAVVRPCDWRDDPAALAARLGAIAAVKRGGAGRFSLSPASLAAATQADRIVLASPNGASCAAAAAGGATVLLGALTNARACAAAAQRELDGGREVTVLASGERFAAPHPEGELRFALEDWLGAGAIVAGLRGERSADARAAALTFEATGPRLAELVRACESGRELIDRGWPGDVEAALARDSADAVPRLVDGWFRA